MGKENAIKEIIPSYKQGLFLSCPANEILFGGARGPGKTAGLIFDYIKQFLHIHGLCKGVIFRRTFSELEDIIEKCDEFLKPLGFVLNKGDYVYRHKSGATLKLRYMNSVSDSDNYQGHEYTWVGFDEVGNLKSLEGIERIKATIRNSPLPPRLVMSANPGGRAHKILKDRFMNVPAMQIQTNEGWTYCYIPAVFSDNTYLVAKDPEYLNRATTGLPSYLKKAWREGDWDISFEAGMYFAREDFQGKIVSHIPGIVKEIRVWDRAATEPSDKNQDPDWTAGVKIGVSAKGDFYILDVIRFRKRGGDTEDIIKLTAQTDGRRCEVGIVQDPGQAGKDQADAMVKKLPGYITRVFRESGKKYTRWEPLSAALQNGIIYLKEAHWNSDFIEELVFLTQDDNDYDHDDQADAASLAFSALAKKPLDINLDSLGKLY